MQRKFYLVETALFSLFFFFAAQTSLFGQLTVQVLNNPASCNGLCNGSATASVSGGTQPYQYIWNTGATTATATGLCANTYDVTVTDAAGQSTVGWANITQPTQLVVQAYGTDQICNVGPEGTATAVPSGGTAPYSYTWNTGGTTAQITNLVAGTYHVTVTDAKGCTAQASATVILSNEGIWLMDSVANVSCAGQNNGYLWVSPMSGAAPYTYLWSTGATTKDITGLAPGNYTVTVNSQNGCQAVTTFTITQPAPVAISTSQVSAACGANNGSATATVSGGNGGFTYAWSNAQSGATISNLAAGSYTVTATDTKGCSATTTAVVQSGSSSLNAAISIGANPGCNANGTITASATGGSGNYAYAWSNGGNTAAISVAAGTYTVTVTDSGSGCTGTSSVVLTAASAPTVQVSLVSNATCSVGGSATATATGGTAPYTYLWDNTQTTATATNLSGGVHTVTVTSANGCSATGTITIMQSQGPSNVTATLVSNATCLTGGSATAAATGGTTPYTYLWDNNQTTATATNLSAGNHFVTVTDAAGCSGTASVSIGSAPAPSATISASANATCSQGGSATVTASGGTAPYTYAWSNSATTASVASLAAGTYTVTVTDAAGCTKTTSVTIGLNNTGIKVGDYVWFDIDQDGLQETGELGAQGITVMLMTAGPDGVFGTADDITKATDITDADGKYLFDCVDPGTYIIMFSNIPAGYQFTAKDNVNNDCKDSDANAAGKTAPFTVLAGSTDNLCLDAGIHILCNNVTFAGTIGNDQTICEGETPATLMTIAPPAGGSGAFEYLWMTLDKSGPTPTWVGINGATSETYNPGPLTQTSYFMRCIRRAGCTTFFETNIVTITVKPAGSPGCTQFLTAFTVNSVPNQGVAVEWTVNSEPTAVVYNVQYSKDKNTWVNIHTQVGQNTGGSASYQYMHKAPQIGSNYYRIMRVNAFGDVTYSDERTYQMNTEAVTIFPNPSINDLYMRNNLAFTDALEVQIYDAAGRLVVTTVLEKGALGDQSAPVQNLGSGVYLVKITKGGETIQTSKITRY